MKTTFSLLTLGLLLFSCVENVDKTKTPTEIHKTVDYSENRFTSGIEGPAVDDKGILYVVNYMEEGTIGKITTDGKSSLFVKLPEGSIGNGIRFNSDYSAMFVADYKGHNVLKIDMKSKEVEVFAHNDEMNQPNDLAITSNGFIYLSDPNWKDGTGNLWLATPQGALAKIASDMGTTNGVAISPDDQYLYVNESVQRRIWRFKLDNNQIARKKSLFYQFEDGGMDGMRCDVAGNLYVARYEKGNVAVISAKGELQKEIPLTGNKPTNVAFGGSDGRTMYVTMQERGLVEAFLVDYPGASF